MTEETTVTTTTETPVTESNPAPVATTTTAAAGGGDAPVMSKRQKNRMLREQHRKEAWKAKRKQERERKKQKRAAAAAAAKESNAPDSWVARKRKKAMWKEIDELGIKPSATVVIDLFFSDKMTPKESKSLINQICYSYSYNGRSKVVEDEPRPLSSLPQPQEKPQENSRDVPKPDDVMNDAIADATKSAETITTTTTAVVAAHEIPKFFDIVMSSFQGPIVDYAERLGGKEFWKFTSWDPRHLTEIFPKEKIVYLTSESDNVLEDVVDDKVYVIGGIVDHNRLKGITHEDATKRGLYTARLPLDEYVDMQSRKVLTVNHVFMILLGVLNTHDWAKTLSTVLPKRKDPHFKTGSAGNSDDDDDDDDDNEKGKEEEEENEKVEEKDSKMKDEEKV